MPKLITPRILHDQPLELPGDRAEFHFDDYANTFARLIADPKTRMPLVLGVSGKWGSGKTTLLKKIRSKLDETEWLAENLSKLSFVNSEEETKDFRRCRTVWFNAWKYADEDQLLVALVRVIVQAMSNDDLVSKFLSAALDPSYPRRDVVATVLSWFAIKAPGVEVKVDVDKYKTETPFAEKAALLDLFSETFDRLMAVWVHHSLDAKKIDPQKGVMVVFIDDLDRCLPDKAVQVLEAVKLFLDRPGAAFVLAADEDAIRAAIEAHYQTQKIAGQRASDYLEKIYQIRFVLPPLAAPQVSDYLTAGLGGLDDQLRQCLDLIVAGAETNPRQIKTFLNYLNVGWAILKNSGQAEGVEQADFIRWLALTRVGADFGDKVRELPKDVRLDFIADAIQWANDPTHKPGEYEQWGGVDHRRLRDVLKLIEFSPKVTADVLEGFVFWNGLDELEEKRRLEERRAELQTKLEAYRQADVTRLAEQRAKLEAWRRAGQPEVMRGVERGPKREGLSLTAGDYWIPIPTGKFVMGSRDDNKLAADDEHPQHTVEIPYTYRIARHPATNFEFAEFVKATKRKSKAVEADLPDHPVVDVSWRDARAYCKWLTEQLRADGTLDAKEIARLPTEAEWEKAARGEYGKEWPWGDEWDAAKCNSEESKIGTTTSVGQYSPQGDSPYGVADMIGNVWERCQSKYKPYPYNASDGREKPSGGESRVLRGGSWANSLRSCRPAYRSRGGPTDFDSHVGFRVALSPV